jgi:hypothetical protein
MGHTELRQNGVLRSSALPVCSDVFLCPGAHTLAAERRMLRSLRGQSMPREGAGQLPALLLDRGQPPATHSLPAS